jgi:hypothetical protein
MNSVQRRFASAWDIGSAEERFRARKALNALTARKSEVDQSARARDLRKEIFRHGGEGAAALAACRT